MPSPFFFLQIPYLPVTSLILYNYLSICGLFLSFSHISLNIFQRIYFTLTLWNFFLVFLSRNHSKSWSLYILSFRLTYCISSHLSRIGGQRQGRGIAYIFSAGFSPFKTLIVPRTLSFVYLFGLVFVWPVFSSEMSLFSDTLSKHNC